MRILIDFTQIPVRRAGAGVYAENLVLRIHSFLGPDDLLYILLQKDEAALPRALTGVENVRLLFVPSRPFRNRLLLMLYEQLVLPFVLLFHRIDVLHSLHYTIPALAPCARVVTFHDLTMLLSPQLHTRGRRLIMPLYMKLAWRLADVIVFVSAATRQDAERLLPTVNHRVNAVVPLGVDLESLTRMPAEDIARRLAALEVSRPYILFIGTIEPRKNLVRVIQAFESIAPEFPEHWLILAGKLGWTFEPVLQSIEHSAARNRIRRLGYISEEDKRALLAAGDLLVYPSLYEGFGLPVLEGMAAGIPTITSNVSSLPEVAGTAAITVDPESVEQLVAAMKQLLGSPALSANYREMGLERARMFSWSNTAAETFQVYKAACRMSSHQTGLPKTEH